MSDTLIRVHAKCQMFWQSLLADDGQDLVEYAAVIVLVVLALTGGMTTLANAINNAMTNVGTMINATIG